MPELNDKQVAEFYRRSFTTADGLWFMKVEDKFGFDAALGVDNEVWKVLPKIQARMLKSMMVKDNGMEALYECLVTKLTMDGFKFTAEYDTDNRGFRLIIEKCPWHDLMVKSGRENLSGQVGTVVCNSEYSVWAAEFDDKIRFKLQGQLCKKAETCVLQFYY
jgi:hypothetical protein